MLGIIVSVLALGFIILIHELGHFLFAKLFGVGVVEFAIGMGPRLFSFVRGETRYSLRALPLGGACMMLGEEDEEKETSGENGVSEDNLRRITNGAAGTETVTVGGDTVTVDGRSFRKEQQFYSKPAWQRFLVIAAGPLFNFILAFLLSLIVTVNIGWDRPVIVDVTPGSPAETAGIRPGDTVASLSICGRKTSVLTSGDMQLFFTANAQLAAGGEEVEIVYVTPEGIKKKSRMKAVFDGEAQAWRFGLSYRYAYEKCGTAGEVIRVSAHNIVYGFRSTTESFRMLFRKEVPASEVKGVVGMVAIMDESVEEAYQYSLSGAALTLLNIMVLLSASLGVMNLLPLPALDGGRLVFILIEMITGKAVPKRIEGIIHAAGAVLLMAFMILIMFNDVWNLIK